MTRPLRRGGAPQAETAEPRQRFLVPRHRWPAAWEALSAARAAFVTGLGQAATGEATAAPIEVYVAERGAAILERVGGRRSGTGRDPWQARMREFERLQREVANRAQRDAGAADALEVAFQREADRKRAQLSDADEPPGRNGDPRA